MLDIAINDIATTSFRHYLENYNLSKIQSVRTDFVTRLKAHHMDASTYQTINVNKLPSGHGNKQVFADHNFTAFKTKIGNDKLLVVSANMLGAVRHYYAFIPLSSPKAVCELEGRLINVNNNKVLWRYTSNAVVPVAGKWDQPPNYPNFTRALNKAVKLSKAQLFDNFFKGTSG